MTQTTNTTSGMAQGQAAAIPVITWFEIPSSNYDRAIKFYETVLKTQLNREEMDGIAMAVFPHIEGQASGAVVHGAPYTPSDAGTCIYLYTTDLDGALQRTTQSGGKVVMPKTFLSDCIGYIAMIIDTEGNRIGLHHKPE